MNLGSKIVQDKNGNAFAPITTPNAVRFSDGTNLNDHLDNSMKPEKLTLRLVPPSGVQASVLYGVHIQISVNANNAPIMEELYNDTWDGNDIELEIGTTNPGYIMIDTSFSNRYIPSFDEKWSKWSNDNPNYYYIFLPLFNNEREIEINYIDLNTAIATIYIDDTINDPYDKIQETITDYTIIQGICQKFHRYLGTYDNGVLKLCQLHDHYSYYFNDYDYDRDDGTQVSPNGSMGDVFVTCEVPIYTRYSVDTSLGHNRHKIEFSLNNDGSGWKEWHFGFGNDRDVIGAYKLSIVAAHPNPEDFNDFIPRSIVNTLPWYIGNSTVQGVYPSSIEDFFTIFENSPFRMVSWDEHNIIGTLFYAVNRTTYSQDILGNPSWHNKQIYNNGNYINSYIPYENGAYTYDYGTQLYSSQYANNFLGIENWIGQLPEIIGNAKLITNQQNKTVTISITERDNTTRTINFPSPTYTDQETETWQDQDNQGNPTGPVYNYTFTYAYYETSIFPHMQFGQNLDMVATGIDYNSDYYTNDYSISSAYHDAHNFIKQYIVSIDSGTLPPNLEDLDEYQWQSMNNMPIIRAAYPNSSNNTTPNGGISSLSIYNNAFSLGSSISSTKIGSRMCYTGTVQLINDPADYLALFE